MKTYEVRRYMQNGGWSSQKFTDREKALRALDWYARNLPRLPVELVELGA